MSTLATVLRALADVALAPFAHLPKLAGVLALSAALGVLLLLAFRWLTPQRALRRTKERIHAALYEMRIFSDRPGLVLRAAGRSLAHLGVYLLLTLPAFAVLAPAVGLVLWRATTYWELRPLRVGETALVSIELDSAAAAGPVAAAASPGIAVRPPVVTVASLGRAYVRVRAEAAGLHSLRIRAAGAEVDKRVAVGEAAFVSPARSSAVDPSALLSHEPPLQGAVREVIVDYPSEPTGWLGLPWYVLLLLVSLAVALALRRPLGVVL